MQVIHPTFLWLTLLAIIPIALYLFRRKSKTIDVSTLVFFKSLAREHQESAWLRRLKKIVSFLLTLILLLAAISALSRLIVSPKGDDVRSVVILLDRSASMAATDAQDRTRLAVAKSEIRQRLAGLSEDIGVALVAYDRRPEVVVPNTLKRREFLSRLDQIQVRPVAANFEIAAESAAILAELETPARIWHFTDEVEPEDEAFPISEAVTSEWVSITEPSVSNVGITAFRVRASPLEHSQYEIYAEVGLNEGAPQAVEARLDVFVGGVFSRSPTIELEPGERESISLKVGGVEQQKVRLKLHAEDDALATDNEVLVPLPEVRPVSVALISPPTPGDPERPQSDAFLELALAALHDGETIIVGSGTPKKFENLSDIDVVIFDRVLPKSWPKDLPVIAVNPPGNAGPIRAQSLENAVPHESVRVADEAHPLLFRVSSSRLAIAQTNVFNLTGSLQPIWFAGKEPILAAGEVEGQRLVLMGFSPSQSEQLPLLASFPLLMGNAILWCAEQSETVRARIQENATGEVVPVEGESVTWTSPVDGTAKSTMVELESPILELDRIGVWESDAGQKGSAYLLSWSETNLPSLPAERDDSAVVEPVRASGGFGGDLTWILLSVLVLLLLVESYLFHRHAVY